MDREKLDKFRDMLLEMQRRTTGDFERAVESSSEEFGGELPDINDDASRAVNRRLMLEISDKNHNTLVQIAEALERITAGDYGQCTECGEDIPEKRLELLPFALHCVKCKERMEKEGT